jgi:hypothetical protein
MWNSGIRPRDMVTSLANPLAGPRVTTVTRKDITNLTSRHRQRELDGRSPLQWLFAQLDEPEKYVYRDLRDPSERIQCLFIAPRAAIPLLRDAPDVLVMDCTYKTNKFRMPLLSICGVSPLKKAFQVAAVFLDGESERQYAWALEALFSYISESSCDLPRCIVTDRDLGLLRALKNSEIGSKIPHLLCRWHVNMNVLAKTKPFFPKPTRQPDGRILRHPTFQEFLKA